VTSVAWSPDGQRALSGSDDKTVRLWEVETGRCERVLEGHTAIVGSVAWSPDGQRALSGSADSTVRLWEVETGRCERVLEGHSGSVGSVAWSPGGQRALSGSDDKTVRLWEVETGRCERVLEGHSNGVPSVAWSRDGQRALSAAWNGVVRLWNLSAVTGGQQTAPVQVQYTNAKVLLVGESGVGKAGLSNYLAHGVKVAGDNPLASTDGAWATHWPLPHGTNQAGVQREIWLWDFAGQVDYRLVHQLFLGDAAAAVLVFNPQRENPFEELGRWDSDLKKAAQRPHAKLLVAGRIDRGGLVVSTASVAKFMQQRGFTGPLHQTSALTGEGCEQLKNGIVEAIDWRSIPETTSPALYHRLKQEILTLRDSGTVLIRMAELKQRMELTLRHEAFDLAQLEAVVSLLAGPGMIQRLDFGGFILLRPEVLSRYASAVVRKVRRHPQELGCIREDELLAGDLDYQDFERLPRPDEEVVLRALLEAFLSRAWCLRQPCDGSSMLTFPSYFRRERPDQPSHPSVLVTYRFDGPVDDIYATLVVRLHHTQAFESTDLWRHAADFKTQAGEKLGFTLKPKGEGTSDLQVYFEPGVDGNSRIGFLRYVHDHLKQYGQNVVRLRHYACGNKKCKDFEKPFENQTAIEEALAPGGSGKVFCPKCGKAIALHDLIEQKFDSPRVKDTVRAMQGEVQVVLDKERLQQILAWHAESIAVEAGQVYRGHTNRDDGIDGEIVFNDDQGRPTGKRLYLRFKSGDSNQYARPAGPAMLVFRTRSGEIRWMDISAYRKQESGTEGERFDPMSVLRWRQRVLTAEP
ncbi:MAG: hypothetical protein FJW40_26210, partial [Acidobacteria bacterium]|nr:hypothetical protein [Acidobacteriota bacterium]